LTPKPLGCLTTRRSWPACIDHPSPAPPPSSSTAAIPLACGRRVKAREATAQRFGLDTEDSAETIEQRGGRQHQLGRLRLGGLRPAFVQVINAGSCPLVTVVAGGSPLHRARNGHSRGIGTQAAIARLGVASGVLLHICSDGGQGVGVGFRTRPGEGDSSYCELPSGSGLLVQLDHER
jgi:hypothetical protein